MNKWEEFGRWCLTELWENIGSDLDGDSAQDKAEELGLLHRVHVLKPCSDNCACADYGDFPQECLRIIDENIT